MYRNFIKSCSKTRFRKFSTQALAESVESKLEMETAAELPVTSDTPYLQLNSEPIIAPTEIEALKSIQNSPETIPEPIPVPEAKTAGKAPAVPPTGPPRAAAAMKPQSGQMSRPESFQPKSYDNNNWKSEYYEHFYSQAPPPSSAWKKQEFSRPSPSAYQSFEPKWQPAPYFNKSFPDKAQFGAKPFYTKQQYEPKPFYNKQQYEPKPFTYNEKAEFEPKPMPYKQKAPFEPKLFAYKEKLQFDPKLKPVVPKPMATTVSERRDQVAASPETTTNSSRGFKRYKTEQILMDFSPSLYFSKIDIDGTVTYAFVADGANSASEKHILQLSASQFQNFITFIKKNA